MGIPRAVSGHFLFFFSATDCARIENTRIDSYSLRNRNFLLNFFGFYFNSVQKESEHSIPLGIPQAVFFSVRVSATISVNIDSIISLSNSYSLGNCNFLRIYSKTILKISSAIPMAIFWISKGIFWDIIKRTAEATHKEIHEGISKECAGRIVKGIPI